MGKIYASATEVIGHTPLLEIKNFAAEAGIEDVTLLAKVEFFNPAGSVKDRVALAMIEDAEKKGILKPGAAIIEPTSGNTGIGLASVAAARGYRTVLTLPETMSVERRTLLGAYGAELVLTDGKKGMQGAIERAEELQKEIPGSVILGQFDNPANPAAHAASTGPEIWEDTEGRVDLFVAGVGTGGTITGIGVYLKSRKPGVQVIAVEDAYAMGRLLARREGILVGITSGAALDAAVRLARRPENRGKTIVVLLPDSGDRYLSTPMFSQE